MAPQTSSPLCSEAVHGVIWLLAKLATFVHLRAKQSASCYV